MPWKFFTNTGQQKTFDSSVASSVSTVASASSIAVTGPGTYLLTGTTTVATITGGAVGMTITVQASGQASGTPVVLTYGAGSNAIKLSGGRSLGIYAQVPADTAAGAGESVTLRYDGTAWVEIARDLRSVIDYVQITSPVTVTGTTAALATTCITSSTFTVDGATPFEFKVMCPSIQCVGSSASLNVNVWEGSTDKGNIGRVEAGGTAGTAPRAPMSGSRRYVPAAASYTWTAKAWRTVADGEFTAGAGTAGTYAPAYMQITRAI